MDVLRKEVNPFAIAFQDPENFLPEEEWYFGSKVENMMNNRNVVDQLGSKMNTGTLKPALVTVRQCAGGSKTRVFTSRALAIPQRKLFWNGLRGLIYQAAEPPARLVAVKQRAWFSETARPVLTNNPM
ncbi:hypothetical protein E2C01_047404 [Portunus trituberculatus]|uniref:Uncharacterized protein n=1 Tax=Portunus trituberculatus TaxID=210409 RepID=A0A5B7G0B8_PORTR|nr:hypothetical protein [Portunus trituberculatus]